MDEGSPPRRIDYPELVESVSRVEPRLQTAIVIEARQGDFDCEQDVRTFDLFELDALRIDDKVGLDESVGAQINRSLYAEPHSFGQRASDRYIQRRLDQLVDVRFRLHRHDLAFDQLEILFV